MQKKETHFKFKKQIVALVKLFFITGVEVGVKSVVTLRQMRLITLLMAINDNQTRGK